MERAKVFISSVLNRSIEDLWAERKTAREVVESYRFLTAWAFEKAPASFEDLDESYLRNVDECDLFVLVVGRETTNPVAAEMQRAKRLSKPILVFAKALSGRTPMTQTLLDGVGTKYASFETNAGLRQIITDAIDHALVLGLRSLPGRSRTTNGELRQLSEKKTHIRVVAAIPRFAEQDAFHVEKFDERTTVLEKHSTQETLDIPTTRISEILFYGDHQKPLVVLDGRLQWVSRIQRWRFFPEKPEPDLPLGFSKPSTLHDPRAMELVAELRKGGYEPGWADELELPSKQNPGYQVVYDDDGRYFRIADPVRSLVLIARRV